jgi:hypothetical protein
MARIAEFTFVGMTFKACARQANIIGPVITRCVRGDIMPDGRVPPLLQKLHMILLHVFSGLNALIFANREGRLGNVVSFPAGSHVPGREGRYAQEDRKAADYFAFVIHLPVYLPQY